MAQMNNKLCEEISQLKNKLKSKEEELEKIIKENEELKDNQGENYTKLLFNGGMSKSKRTNDYFKVQSFNCRELIENQ